VRVAPAFCVAPAKRSDVENDVRSARDTYSVSAGARRLRCPDRVIKLIIRAAGSCRPASEFGRCASRGRSRLRRLRVCGGGWGTAEKSYTHLRMATWRATRRRCPRVAERATRPAEPPRANPTATSWCRSTAGTDGSRTPATGGRGLSASSARAFRRRLCRNSRRSARALRTTARPRFRRRPGLRVRKLTH
jgi:hypothetical protein